MRAYRRLQILVFAALAFVLVVGLGGTLTPSHEIFPFASWLLFSLVPGQRSEFDIVLRATGDKAIDPPRSYGEADGLVRHPHSIVVHSLIQELGVAEAKGDGSASRKLRRQIEAEFDPGVTRYDLVHTTYQPIVRWRTGQVQRTESVREFTVGTP